MAYSCYNLLSNGISNVLVTILILQIVHAGNVGMYWQLNYLVKSTTLSRHLAIISHWDKFIVIVTHMLALLEYWPLAKKIKKNKKKRNYAKINMDVFGWILRQVNREDNGHYFARCIHLSLYLPASITAYF